MSPAHILTLALLLGASPSEPAAPSLSPPPGARVTLSISATEVGEGVPLMVQLFDSEEGFPKSPTATTRAMKTVVKGGGAQVVFEGIPPGTYAGVMFADLDGDGALGRNWWGFPTEPVGLTLPEGATLRGPPSFKSAAFVVGGESLSLKVGLWVP